MKFRGSYFAYFLMNTFYFLGLALFSVIISIYLMGLGFDAHQVSLVMITQYVLCMISSPVIGQLCDRFDKRIVGAILLALSALLGIVFIYMRSLFSIMIVYGLTMALFYSFNPIIERISVLSSHSYSGIRIWSTIGYAAGTQLAGLIYHYISPQAIYIFFSISMVLCMIGLAGTKDKKAPAVKAEKTSSPIRQPHFIFYLVIAAIFYAATNISSTYLPSFYHARGLSVSHAASIISLCTLTELPVIILGSHFISRISNKTLLLADIGMITIQFLIYSLVHFMPLLIITTILTKASTTMAFILINQKVVATIVDEKHQMSALSIVGTIRSFSSIAIQFGGGYLIDLFSYSTFYLTLSFLGMLGLILVLCFKVPAGNKISLFE